jgi:hypothetical protein
MIIAGAARQVDAGLISVGADPRALRKPKKLIDTPAPLVADRLDGLRLSAGRVGLRRMLFRDLNIVTRKYGRSRSLDRPYRAAS